MISFPCLFPKPPSLQSLPLKRYRIHLSLSHLNIGTDSIHIDVHISPQVCSAVKQAVAVSLIKHTRSEAFFESKKKERRGDEKLVLNNLCTEVLREGINRAKAQSEIQIDYLGQVALAKLFLEEIGNEYRKLVRKFELLIRDFQLSRDYIQYEWLKMRDKLTEIKHNQDWIVRSVGEEMFQVLADVHDRNLRNMREAIFSSGSILPDRFFVNPTLHTDKVANDFLLMEAYVLMGQRSDEPDNYDSLKAVIFSLLDQTDLGQGSGAGGEGEHAEAAEVDTATGNVHALDPWLREIDNINLMFNYFDTKDRYKRAKKGKEPEEALLELKALAKVQKQLLNFFYRKFKKAELLDPIVATYEMKPVYRGYCPPLRPLQVREYLLNPESRKAIVRELHRHKSAGDYALAPLQETIRRVRGSASRNSKAHLLSFLRDFSRYHRDLENTWLLKQAMDAIALVADERILLLSKKNRLLYEFPLPGELVKEENPITGHVVLKADIRGSMDITQTMIARRLNPAAYFSLNFFDPISTIICDYDAAKVFIEGDAIILSIFEHGVVPKDGYSVARACGLAVNMLQIVRQYNEQNQKHDLPILELGIGICYKPNAPAFLFDGDSRIMISQAINRADRLSGCDKKVRKRFGNKEGVFNLFVFQDVPDEDIAATADDLFLRYNVNGIELDQEGFARLSGEIHLKRLVYSMGNNEEVTLYTGKVPTLSGKYQRLVIREAVILKIKQGTLDMSGPTAKKYYEVCTHPAIYEFADSQTQ
jgi:hypothetical protein